jgi:hypothetical protein
LLPEFGTLVSIAKALSVGLSQLLSFNENLIFNNYIQEQNEGQFVVYNNTSIDKVEELYKQLLKEKDEVIELLKNKFSNSVLIPYYKFLLRGRKRNSDLVIYEKTIKI